MVGQWLLDENGWPRYEISETEIPLRISVDPDPFYLSSFLFFVWSAQWGAMKQLK